MWLFIPSACVPESAASTWDSKALERLAASATSSGKHFRPHVWSRRCKEASWPKLLSGVTYEPSMLQRGVAAWISSLAATRASRFHSPDSAKASTTRDTFGPKSCGSTAPPAPDTCSARTSPDTFRLGSPLSLPTLPRSGRLSNGICTERPTLERRTNENGYSFWPSATVSDAASAARHTTKTQVMHSGTSLTDAMRLWPTPDAMVAQNGENPTTWIERRERMKAKGYNGNGMGTPLVIAAAMWSTPTVNSAKSLAGPAQFQRNSQPLDVRASLHNHTITNDGGDGLQKAVLNPLFVEALMGFPIGWTDCEHSEMPLCRK